jgi:LacI family transcriptional regulator
MAERGSRSTIHTVAVRAGVSVASVSRHINGTANLSPATRAAIDEAIRALDFRPNRLARNLRVHATQMIAVLLPDITNPFYPGLVRGAQVAAHRQHYTVLLGSGEDPDDTEGAERYLDMLRTKQIDGALLVGMTLPKSRLAPLVSDGFPIVALDRDVDLPRVPLVQVDNVAGGRLATQHLLSQGHRNIAHLAGEPGLKITEDRRTGWLTALSDAGVRPDPRLEFAGGFTEAEGHCAACRLIESGLRATAVFAASDLAAIGALKAFRQHGWSVPDDVSLVGFDDLRVSSYVSPGLTTVRQPALQIGERATDLLIKLIRDPGSRRPRKPVLFEPTLIVRDSTAPPAAARR